MNLIQEEKVKLESKIPIVVKISPDISEEQVELASKIMLKHKVSAVIISNTTSENREKLNNILKQLAVDLDTKILNELENEMDFSLTNHYKERISFHMKMLNYYLKQSKE